MGCDLFDTAAHVFEAASDISGFDVRDMLTNGTEEELKQTSVTQVVVTAVNAAAYHALVDHLNSEAYVCAGFSLGELTAYHASGMLDLENLFRLVNTRARIMADAADAVQQELGSLGMAAVIGMDFDTAAALIEEHQPKYLYAANDNSPVQVVLSGLESSLETFIPVLKEHGARRVIPLRVSAPFHTPLLADARKQFASEIEDIVFEKPLHQVYTTVTGDVIPDSAAAKEFCIQQLTSPVRWTRIMKQTADLGIRCSYELGPGKALTGFWSKTVPGIPCLPAGTRENIDKIRDGEYE
jgi:[acyl-carrier-protein] S-malonyltransferase